jgi:curli biogenesis system outer membrane secretion channel CsgG
MMRSSRIVLAIVLVAGTLPLNAADPPTIGIVPFDVSTVEGKGGADSGRVLGTLVRVEMLKNKQIRPQVIELPAGVRPPLTPQRAAELGKSAGVDLILLGTVLEASSSRNNNRASTSRLGGIIGSSVGGSVTRTTAKISLHAELVESATGRSVDTFEVEASNTDTGVGADLWSTLGNFNLGDDGWQKTPMGKALREAAQKLTTEVAKRAVKP